MVNRKWISNTTCQLRRELLATGCRPRRWVFL